jgi:hypothetical protein
MTSAVVATCGVAVLLGWFWFGLPLSRFVGDPKRSSSREAGS